MRANPLQLVPQRLLGQVVALMLVLMLLQALSSILFYRSIDRQTLHEDHARRVAELLVVGHRLDRLGSVDVSKVMTTRHLDVQVGPQPTFTGDGERVLSDDVREQILKWEPELAGRPLLLGLRSAEGRDHLVGALRLSNGDWLSFRSRDFSGSWPVVLRATVLTLVLTAVCVVVMLLALLTLGEPLRRLTAAAQRVGEGRTVTLAEQGTGDLRRLSRAFNEMQARIAGLMADQARSFEAISHDLRTPLSRLILVGEMVEPDDIRDVVRGGAEEMETMLKSLQGFLRAQHLEAPAETVDLAQQIRAIAAEFGSAVTVNAPEIAIAETYREPLALALHALIENACRYAGAAEVSLAQHENGAWRIRIDDRGPGIPQADMEQILTPFFRVDRARARDVPGFGLGIPTAHRLMQRFGGALAFSAHPAGGLSATVMVPPAG